MTNQWGNDHITCILSTFGPKYWLTLTVLWPKLPIQYARYTNVSMKFYRTLQTLKTSLHWKASIPASLWEITSTALPNSSSHSLRFSIYLLECSFILFYDHYHHHKTYLYTYVLSILLHETYKSVLGFIIIKYGIHRWSIQKKEDYLKLRCCSKYLIIVVSKHYYIWKTKPL